MQRIAILACLCSTVLGLGLLGPDNSAKQSVASIPESLIDNEGSFLRIWRLAQATPRAGIGKEILPKSVIIPVEIRMLNLVPQDAANPLYDESSAGNILRNHFLRNYLTEEEVDFNAEELNGLRGKTVLNLNDLELVFKKDTTGKVTVNDVPVSKFERMHKDGLYYYELEGFLFDDQQEVDKARESLPQTPFFGVPKVDTPAEPTVKPVAP